MSKGQKVVKAAKRVLYANPTHKMGGAEFSLLALMEKLNRRLYEPILLCPSDGLLSQMCHERNIKTLFLPSIPPPAGRAITAYRTLLQNAFFIKRLIQKFDISLVHSNSPRMAYHSGLAARWARVPHITHVRHISDSVFASPLKSRFLLYLSQRILTVSEATSAMIIQHAPYAKAKVEVVHNGIGSVPTFDQAQIQACRAEFGSTNDDYLLAIIGAITPLKGQEVILRALPTILSSFPQCKLLIVGQAMWPKDIEYAEQLRVLAKELGISEHLIWTGFRRDIPRLLASIDLLIHCPIEADAFPRILLEAGTQATLIVASRIGGIPEQVLDGETGLLVEPNQPEALAQAVIKLLEDRQLSQQLGVAAQQRTLAVFSIEQHVRKMVAIYQTLLSQ